jgi:hypothetical protein
MVSKNKRNWQEIAESVTPERFDGWQQFYVDGVTVGCTV